MEGSLGKVIFAFLLLLIGISLLVVTATQTNEKVTLLRGTQVIDTTLGRYGDGNLINESYVYTVTTVGDTSVDCPFTDFVLTNVTGQERVAGNYTFINGGRYLTYVNGTAMINLTDAAGASGTLENTTYINYTYCPAGYMQQGWGRSTIKIVPGFFALALMAIGIGLFWDIYRKWDLKR